ncbi:unnamed protein product [Euphydryas editha]|uniref:Uncharacterized protein n=1 Tax=Euphydryas editha TaxID=104508 RepID=A0AAU9VC29_EUPED|nr:unnamed protein product [Euphydryas editha]CAH2107778.1 unnamed protein product [Euphydryas editha]CAH2107780.1 unnamed protein product [Euphydryas editha]
MRAPAAWRERAPPPGHTSVARSLLYVHIGLRALGRERAAGAERARADRRRHARARRLEGARAAARTHVSSSLLAIRCYTFISDYVRWGESERLAQSARAQIDAAMRAPAAWRERAPPPGHTSVARSLLYVAIRSYRTTCAGARASGWRRARARRSTPPCARPPPGGSARRRPDTRQ